MYSTALELVGSEGRRTLFHWDGHDVGSNVYFVWSCWDSGVDVVMCKCSTTVKELWRCMFQKMMDGRAELRHS